MVLTMENDFKPDPIKQAQEIIFSRKATFHPGLLFNNNIVNLTAIHKDLGVIFDSKLSFHKHVKSELKKYVNLLVYFENSKVSSLGHP